MDSVLLFLCYICFAFSPSVTILSKRYNAPFATFSNLFIWVDALFLTNVFFQTRLNIGFFFSADFELEIFL